MSPKLLISTILGSYNRLKFLKLTIDSIRKELEDIQHEIIVIDGGSTDGTLKWLSKQKDIVSIIQHNHGHWNNKKIPGRSWGYFMNLAFKCAQGEYLCMLSDDCLIVPGAIINGADLFEKKLNEGMKLGAISFYFRNWPEDKKYYVNLTINDTMMVNHGLYLKKALEDVGYIDEENYFFYHADDDLSLKLKQSGYYCIDSPNSYVEHSLHINESLRGSNSQVERRDYKNLLNKWEKIYSIANTKKIHSKIEKEYSDPDSTVDKFKHLLKYYDFKNRTWLLFLKVNRRRIKILKEYNSWDLWKIKIKLIKIKIKHKIKKNHDFDIESDPEFLKINRRRIKILKGNSSWDLWKTKIKLSRIKIKHKITINFNMKNVKMSDVKIDIIIPAIEKDIEILPYVIDSAKEYIKHPIGEIIVISPDSKIIKDLCKKKNCKFINEDHVLYIKKNDINFKVRGIDRSGWLFQQFLKWGADILCSQKHYLVLDADTIFINPVVFKYNNKTIFDISDEYHKPYFGIFKRLFGYHVRIPLSFTCHCMLYEKSKILELKKYIEDKHLVKWYEAIMKNMDKFEIAAHSDYDSYGHYVYYNYPDEVILRYWYNCNYQIREDLKDIDEIKNKLSKKYKSVSFHSYIS